MADQMDLLKEQVKMLGGEVALCTSSLKRLSEQAASNPNDSQLQVCYILKHNIKHRIFLTNITNIFFIIFYYN